MMIKHKMFIIYILLSLVSVVICGPATDSYKDQYCTDPRTMRKHVAYTEWADAYSCTRHRCQPGGRNLAIYTVGCKRVEAPESAIECEEVVEDTNMQFPYCCTRLRCLVVVRGEVWTRVLGQPWETLPAAPWSHMYKMKKPPPADGTFLPKNVEKGPVYELAEAESDASHDKVLRAGKKGGSAHGAERSDDDVAPRTVPAPDIVIALSTNNDKKEHKNTDISRHKKFRKTTHGEEPEQRSTDPDGTDMEDAIMPTEKLPEVASDERSLYVGNYGVTQKNPFKTQYHPVSWTEIPQNQWNEHNPGMDTDSNRDGSYHQPDFPPEPEEVERPTNLQALVDAIGTRMRDIESVVHRMSKKVKQTKPGDVEYGSSEKRPLSGSEGTHTHQTEGKEFGKVKQPSPDGEHYKRFSIRNRAAKYVHIMNTTSEKPMFVEEARNNGYFSDASNSVLNRADSLKEPAATYMAPVDTRRKSSALIVSDSDESDKKHKKRTHKKKKGKGHHKKRRGKEEKRKKFNRLNSVETDKNIVSVEDNSAVV